MQESTKHFARWMLSTFLGVSKKRHLAIYSVKLCQEIRLTCLGESPRGGKLVKNLEIFGMNNKTIIESSFRMMWRITQISEAVIHTVSSICIILYILLSLIQ